jgi:hypothetical protein
MYSKFKHDSQKKRGGEEKKTMYTIKAAPTTINNKQQISRVYSVYRFIHDTQLLICCAENGLKVKSE